jgi:Rrf2 family protein
MKFTKQAQYAVIITKELVGVSKPVSLKCISLKTKLSYSFLKKVAQMLREKDILAAIEGKDGGYLLNKPASQINLHEILDAVGESIIEKPCCRNEENNCEKLALCPYQSVFYNIQLAIFATFGELTLDKIVRGDLSCAKLWKREN